MTFAPPDVSRVGARRIGVANAVLWIAGSIVLVIVGATAAYSFVVAPYTGGGIVGIDDFPWEADNPLEATATGDVWAADASAVIRIPAAEFTEALSVTLVSDREVQLFRTNPAEVAAYPGDIPRPVFVGFVDAYYTVPIVPSGDYDLELWVGADGPWQLRLAPIDAVVMGDDGAGGTEDTFLIYRGDAVSGRFVYIGDGIFFVTIYTAYETPDFAIIQSDRDVDQRLSWTPDEYVVFHIESTQGAWTIDIDQLASSTPIPTPSPTETP